MRYKVIKLTVGRNELYDHYKKDCELVFDRAVTDEVNCVDDGLALGLWTCDGTGYGTHQEGS